MTAQNLPAYIPLSEAAERYHLDREVLTRLVEADRIRAVKINGDIAVAEEDVVKQENSIRKGRFEHLRGEGLSISEASRKYDVPYSTLHGWMERGHIEVLNPEQRRQGRVTILDERDVAYRAALYHRLKDMRGGQVAGVRVFAT